MWEGSRSLVELNTLSFYGREKFWAEIVLKVITVAKADQWRPLKYKKKVCYETWCFSWATSGGFRLVCAMLKKDVKKCYYALYFKTLN